MFKLNPFERGLNNFLHDILAAPKEIDEPIVLANAQHFKDNRLAIGAKTSVGEGIIALHDLVGKFYCGSHLLWTKTLVDKCCSYTSLNEVQEAKIGATVADIDLRRPQWFVDVIPNGMTTEPSHDLGRFDPRKLCGLCRSVQADSNQRQFRALA